MAGHRARESDPEHGSRPRGVPALSPAPSHSCAVPRRSRLPSALLPTRVEPQRVLSATLRAADVVSDDVCAKSSNDAHAIGVTFGLGKVQPGTREADGAGRVWTAWTVAGLSARDSASLVGGHELADQQRRAQRGA